MDVNMLSRDELEYELKIRGFEALPDLNVMRNLLRGLLKRDENHLENFAVQPPTNEVEICQRKLREVNQLVTAINGDKSSDSYRLVDSKLNHLLARIDRITTIDTHLVKARSVLLKTILYLMETADKKAKHFSNQQPVCTGEQYQVKPVTRTLVVANTKMITGSPDSNCVKKEMCEVGTEIFNHQGVALKKKNKDRSFDPITGTLSIVQYKNGKCIEWKATDLSFNTENCDAEWESVDAVHRRRTVSTSSNADYVNTPPIRIMMEDLKSYKIKSSSRQVSLRTKTNSRYSFLFQYGNSDGFINGLRSILVTRRAHHSKHIFQVFGERDESKLTKSFNELNIFPDMKNNHGYGQANVWNFVRNFHDRPYETTMQTFSKLTDTLLYRTPEHRPEDAEVAELLTKSLHSDESEKIMGTEYTVVTRNIELMQRPNITRGSPLNLLQWNSFLDEKGRVSNPEAVKKIIFQGGIQPTLRYSVWKYLLNYYPWDLANDKSTEFHNNKMAAYYTIKRQWQTMSQGQEERFSSYREKKSLIEKDVNRTDRNLPFFAGEDNNNLKILNDILMTYVMYNFDIGYVQGMSDLLAPILVLMNNEVDAFWCFVGFMDRVFTNFELDQARMKEQLSELFSLLKVINRELAEYLQKNESANMFFCFRWLLIHFKREFTFDDIMTLWEVLWTDLPCKNFHLILCVAILDTEKRSLMREGMGFTEILKYVNELSCRIDLNRILCEAEGIYEQLKAAGEEIPLILRRIIGLAPEENSVENSDDDSQTNTNYTAILPTYPKKKSDDNDDSIIEDIERVSFTPETGEIGFEAFERAISSNYY